jgi:hypothetical protein
MAWPSMCWRRSMVLAILFPAQLLDCFGPWQDNGGFGYSAALFFTGAVLVVRLRACVPLMNLFGNGQIADLDSGVGPPWPVWLGKEGNAVVTIHF